MLGMDVEASASPVSALAGFRVCLALDESSQLVFEGGAEIFAADFFGRFSKPVVVVVESNGCVPAIAIAAQ